MSNFIKFVLRYVFISKLGILIRKFINTSKILSKLLAKYRGVNNLRNKDASLWKDGNIHKTESYESLNLNANIFLDYVLKNTKKNDKILDICCNQGRFLFFLQSKKYLNLYGFDIMKTAITSIKQREEFNPEVMNIEHCLAQKYFENKSENEFDWAITYSATIELINPEFDIFKELSRTIKKGMVLVINENGHAYPRFYRFLHKINGFKIIEIKTLNDKTLILSKKNNLH